MIEQTRQDGPDGTGSVNDPPRVDPVTEQGDGVDPAAQLRIHTESVRKTGDGLREVHDRLQSSADRVKSLRDVAQRLGDDIARTRDAVDERLSATGE